VCTEEKVSLVESRGLLDLLGNAFRLTMCGLRNAAGATGSASSTETDTAGTDASATTPAVELTAEELAFFDEYAQRAQAVLDRFEGTPLTGEMYWDAAVQAYLDNGRDFSRVVPVDLALAQGQLETRFGTDDSGRPNFANNIYNVGEFDAGTTEQGAAIDSPQEGLEAYFALMASDYLADHSAEELLENFVNTDGNRYASNPDYEQTLADQISVYEDRHGAPTQPPPPAEVESTMSTDPFADWIEEMLQLAPGRQTTPTLPESGPQTSPAPRARPRLHPPGAPPPIGAPSRNTPYRKPSPRANAAWNPRNLEASSSGSDEVRHQGIHGQR
jgi:hypothetical protein